MMASLAQRQGVEEMSSATLTVTRDVSLAPYTTYKVGGPAALFIEVSEVRALYALLERLATIELPWLVLGKGSNVLVADAGFDGAVIQLGKALAEHALQRDALGAGVHRLEVGGAMPINRLTRLASRYDLAGVECLGGVPGSVGGAVRMNAGTVMGEVSDSLESAQVVDAKAGVRWLPAEALKLSYRHSELPEGSVVTAARFRCTDADPAMKARLAEVLAYRKATQPLNMPSCGSVFANPEGDHAGRLIEAAGLKGTQVGGAQVSEVHANWIVNTGDATAADVRALIELCQSRVLSESGHRLRHEVRLLGDWEDAT